MEKHATVVFLNSSPASFALALAATRPSSRLDVKAVFVTGRAAHTEFLASPEERDDVFSDYIHCLNTKRMKEFLASAGRTIPVFMGERIYRTQLRTVISHGSYVDEKAYDLWDATDVKIDGDFTAGLELLSHYEEERLAVLVGGPLTEVALIQRYRSDVAAKFGPIFIHAGDFAGDYSARFLEGEGNLFNGACDPAALHDVLYGHDGNLVLLPSNITRQTELGFTTADEIASLGVYGRLVDLYRVHEEHYASKRDKALYIHGLGLVMLAEEYLTGNTTFPYRYLAVDIIDVPTCKEWAVAFEDQPPKDRRGTVVIQQASESDRYMVVWQDTEGYRARVAAYLQS